MSRLIDISNREFGKLVALRPSKRKVSGSTLWWCLCECGTVKEISSIYLRTDITVCCGCSKIRNISYSTKILADIYVGRPCKFGHSGIRYMSTRNCIECYTIRRKTNEYKEYQNQYRQTEKGKKIHRNQAKRRRAIKNGAKISDLSSVEWGLIKRAFKYCCAYCGKKSNNLTQDHITPLSKGGNHTMSNVVPACGPCNNRKNSCGPLIPVQPLLIVA